MKLSSVAVKITIWKKKKHPFEILQAHYSSPETKHVTFNDFMVDLVVKKKEKLKGTEGTEGVIRSRKLIRLFRIMSIPTTFRLFLVLTSGKIGRRLPVFTLLL
jgi:hypothetical protein